MCFSDPVDTTFMRENNSSNNMEKSVSNVPVFINPRGRKFEIKPPNKRKNISVRIIKTINLEAITDSLRLLLL